ncbi:MAG TPA: glycosyltransferase family 4 protein [Methylomirabilota bacterium]|nr:glycosyltransferase family 4 protein [Methylomirabilota bacterium]
MRILMISGVPGKAEAGVAGIVYNLAKELCGLGHSVEAKFFEDLLPRQKWPNRFRTVEFARRIAGYVDERKSEFDIVNIHAPFGFSYGARRQRFGAEAGPPYVMTMHGLEERRNYAMGREAKKGRADYFRWKNRVWQRAYHMPTYRRSFLTADQCIVTNREALLSLQLHYGLAPDRAWLIPNGVGPEFFHARSYSAGIATRLLFVGTWIDHKGIYYLAEAFGKVLREIPEARLTIAGCTEPEERVRRSFSSTAQAAIDVWPFVPRAEIPSIYAEHEVFVLPSLMEGMPLVLLEAMASGLPVVTTESCGMTDLVEDDHDGIFVIPGDTDSLASAILRLCKHAELRQWLGSAAQEKMRRYTWKRSAQRHERVFNRALGVTTGPHSEEDGAPSVQGDALTRANS